MLLKKTNITLTTLKYLSSDPVRMFLIIIIIIIISMVDGFRLNRFTINNFFHTISSSSKTCYF